MAIPLPSLTPLIPAGLRLAPIDIDISAPIGPRRQRRQKKLQPLTPAEEGSLLDIPVSTVQYLGETLDKPGRAIRGLLSSFGGGPSGGGLANLIPFSDTLEFTDPKDTVSGRDLLTTLFDAPLNKEGFSPIDDPMDALLDLAGFATEVATDPLTLLAGTPLVKGAVKGAAKGAAEAASMGGRTFAASATIAEEALEQGVKASKFGRTAAGVSEQIRGGQRAVWGLKATPFSEPFVTFGSGGAGAKLFANTLDAATYGRLSPLSWLRAALSPATGSKIGDTARIAGLEYAEKLAKRDAVSNLNAALRQETDGLMGEYAERAQYYKKQFNERDAEDMLWAIAETKGGLPAPESISETLAQRFGAPTSTELDALARRTHTYLDSQLGSMNSIGYKIEWLGGKRPMLQDSMSAWWHRQARQVVRDMSKAKRATKGDVAQWVGEERRMHHDYPGGAEFINKTATDHVLWGFRISAEAVDNIKGTIRPGDLVKAADQANYGTVLSAGKDSARVSFVAPDGVEASVDLSNDLLEVIRRGPQDAKNVPRIERMGKQTHNDILRAEVARAGVKPATKTKDLQLQYMQHVLVKPQLDTALAEGLIDEAGYATHWKTFLESDQVMINTGGTVDKTGKIVGGTNQKVSRGWAEDKGYFGPNPPAGDHVVPLLGKEGLNRSQMLLRHLKNMPDEVRVLGYYEHLSKGFRRYMTSALDYEGVLRSAHQYAKQPGVIRMAGAKNATGVSLEEAWKGAGFESKGLGKLVSDAFPEELAKHRSGGGTTEEFIVGLTVDEGLPQGLKMLSSLNEKDTQNSVFKLMEMVKNTYQTYLFLPFPASHARNRLGGIVNAMMDGKVSLAALLKGNREVAEYVRNRTPLSVLSVIDMDDAGMASTRAMDVGGAAAAGMTREPQGGMFDVLKPLSPERLARGITHPIETAKSTLSGVRGGFGAKQGIEFAPNAIVEAGERVFGRVEYFNRLGYAQAMHNKGYSPADIIEAIRRTQFSYKEQSEFHKTVLNRMFLFPTFPIKNIPFHIGKLAESPGGLVAQQARGLAALQSGYTEDQYTPVSMRERMAVPLGGEGENVSWLTGLGLPMLDINERIAVQRGLMPFDIGRTAQKQAASLIPIVRQPLEEFAGKAFWSGRPLGELWSVSEAVTGTRVRNLDRLAHALPSVRGMASIRQASDLVTGRKPAYQVGLNLLTGLRFTSMEREELEIRRQRDLQRAMQERILGDPLGRKGSHYYVPTQYQGTEESAGVEEDVGKERQLANVLRGLYEIKEAKKEAKKK